MKCLLLITATTVSSAFALTYPIVDTGQTQAYGTYTGQDAHYSANAPSYTDNGDGTVTDNVTGLMWTKDPGEKMTHANAVKNASKCRVGGYKDWRLPTIKELYSLMNFNGIDPDPRSEETGNLKPFIDNTVFDFEYGNPAKGERIIDSQFATSTIYTSTTMGGNKTMFGVNFSDGRIKGYPAEKIGRRGEKTYFVLYVRGNPDYGRNQFRDNGDGTITDEATGLTWVQADSGKGMDWPSALEYAEGMEFSGHSDWRLPNAKELQSIVDYTRSPDATDSAAIDPLFQCSEITNEAGQKDYAQYWSSTTHIGSRGADRAAYVCFGRGLGKMRGQWMDVHGAGCQRSDPKTGNIADYPKSHGPQGDVQRLHNFVRLVRGGNVESENVIAPADSNRSIGVDVSPPLIRRFDQNNDGKIVESEWTGPMERFVLLDLDSDGIISREEAEAAPPPPNRGQERQRGEQRRPFELAATQPSTMLPSANTLPNIVFIYVDDLGWTGTSVEMIQGDPATKSDFYLTPNLERVASKGMVFSQAYSPGPMCTPSRAAVLTGRTPAELHITTPGRGRSDSSKKLITPRIARGLPEAVPTIGTVLKKAGYATALLGKWHIGRDDHAGNHGFGLHDGSTENESSGTEEDPKEIFSLTRRGMAFMEENVKAGRPFYLQLSHYALHTPTQARPESIERFRKQLSGGRHIDTEYAAMTWDLDESIGRIFQTLEDLKIAEETYVVVMSDNGAAGNRRRPNNAPLYGGKGTLYEGGIRVPLIIAGPGIQPGYCSEAVSGTDLFATFAAWAGVPDIGNSESVSLQPLLTGKANGFHREKPLLFHFPHYGQGPLQKPQTALISGHWKLLKDWETGTTRLFNLKTDIGEQTDLSKSNPDKLKDWVERMDQRLEETAAQLPTGNPGYKSSSEVQRRRRKK